MLLFVGFVGNFLNLLNDLCLMLKLKLNRVGNYSLLISYLLDY